MWAKSIYTTVVLTQFLVIFQISYGKPATEGHYNHNTTTESVEVLGVREDENSSFVETVAVLSRNDTEAAATQEDERVSTAINSTINTTMEPDYYDDHNLTVSSLNTEPSGLLAEVDDLDDLEAFSSSSINHLGGSTEPSSFPPDDIDTADTIRQTVTPRIHLSGAVTNIMDISIAGDNKEADEESTIPTI